MNYPLRDAALDLLRQKSGIKEFAASLHELTTVYDRNNLFGMYLSMGSHDRKRAIFALDGDKQKVKLLHFIAFAFPGAPAIYYGDEIGLDGGKDPLNRAAFPWDEEKWDKDTLAYMKKLINTRKAYNSLRRGDYKELIQNKEIGYFASHVNPTERPSRSSSMPMTAPSRSPSPLSPAPISNPLPVATLMNGEVYEVYEDSVTLVMKPWSGTFLLPLYFIIIKKQKSPFFRDFFL